VSSVTCIPGDGDGLVAVLHASHMLYPAGLLRIDGKATAKELLQVPLHFMPGGGKCLLAMLHASPMLHVQVLPCLHVIRPGRTSWYRLRQA
jgi:hypothetical protein